MPYPYTKLNLLAIPLTVGFGAMEHPGLITVNQRLVVARRHDFTLGFQRAFAAVTAHELAHQWFGDLVTPGVVGRSLAQRGLRQLARRQGRAGVAPCWDAGVRPVTRAPAPSTLTRSRPRTGSGSRSSPHITSRTPSTGSPMPRAQAVLTMFEHWLGAGTFRDGIRAYLRQHAWQNTTAADSWRP